MCRLIVLLVNELYRFLCCIGRENRLFITKLGLDLKQADTFVENDRLNGNVGRGYYLRRIFNLLSLGHGLKSLKLEFEMTSFATFLYMDNIVDDFSKLQGIEKLELNWGNDGYDWDQFIDDDQSDKHIGWEVGTWQDPPSWGSPVWSAPQSPPSKPTYSIPHVQINVTSFESAAQKLISNAQRPQSFNQQLDNIGKPSLKLARAQADEMCALINSRIAFMTQRETARSNAREYKAKSDLAFKETMELDKIISKIEKDIARMVPDTLS